MANLAHRLVLSALLAGAAGSATLTTAPNAAEARVRAPTMVDFYDEAIAESERDNNVVVAVSRGARVKWSVEQVRTAVHNLMGQVGLEKKDITVKFREDDRPNTLLFNVATRGFQFTANRDDGDPSNDTKGMTLAELVGNAHAIEHQFNVVHPTPPRRDRHASITAPSAMD